MTRASRIFGNMYHSQSCIAAICCHTVVLPPTSCRVMLWFICLLSTLFVVGILVVMTRMGSRGEVLVTVRDQRGEWVDCMGRLHNGDLVRLWRDIQEGLKTTWKSDDVAHELQLHYSMCNMAPFPVPRDLGHWYGTYSATEMPLWGNVFGYFFSFTHIYKFLNTLFSLGQQDQKPYPLKERGNTSQRGAWACLRRQKRVRHKPSWSESGVNKR